MSRVKALIRSMDQRDYGFIMGNWMDSYQRSPYAGVVPNHLYRETMKELIRNLWARGSSCIVAVNAQDITTLLGFCCWEQPRGFSYPILHYIFVKEAVREQAVGHTLAHEAGLREGHRYFYTHRTRYSNRLKGGLYKPEIARRKEPPRVQGIIHSKPLPAEE